MNHLRPSPRHQPNGPHRARATYTDSPVRRGLSMTRDGSIGNGLAASEPEAYTTAEDDPIHLMLKEKWAQSEGRIAALFGGAEQVPQEENAQDNSHGASLNHAAETSNSQAQPARRPARTIDEDDYGDDEDDEEEEPPAEQQSPLRSKSKPLQADSVLAPARSPSLSLKPITTRTSTSSSSEHGKSTEEVRKKLEEDKKAAEDAAKRSFHTEFYTLESDRDAMLEQQKLDELDRQVENEMSSNGQTSAGPAPTSGPAQGSLSNADLGASSLTLKNLIARIDAKRTMVNANDTQLRTLISEVRKGRSKWASEEKVGQEELYEAAEKVLMELKAMTEYSTPFLSRVNKRDAPDYFHIIKHPMDIGTMIKKLKSLSYKSKKEFVSDLDLIWANCLTYNAKTDHPLRRKALYMRKETDKLVPLIPDIVVRDRAEVEAEERRLQNMDAEMDGGEDSDDDRPIMASRGRKAPSKGKKGTSTASRKAQTAEAEEAPATETKPAMHASTSSLRNEFLRADSDAPVDGGSSMGFSTPPPPGTLTPSAMNGSLVNGSQTDVMEVDGMGNAMTTTTEDQDEDDAEFKTWKQVTKKDRAMLAAHRNRIFRGDRLNPEEPALLRTKAGMRRWIRQQKQYLSDKLVSDTHALMDQQPAEAAAGETLAEGIEKDEDSTLPDYYDTLTAIPEINDRLKWIEDSEGKVVPQTEEFLRVFPNDEFTSSESTFTRKMEANIRQMQETRKVTAKIGIVKQMQIQAQTYQNQFSKYDPQPFVEQDVGAVVVSEDGPIMAPWVCRAAFQRAVGKIFYHAGFEDFQPSALDAVTDIATDFFAKLTRSLGSYREAPKPDASADRFTAEEQVLHCLYDNGIDLEALETYVNEDVDRLGSKLAIVHERMKAHLADLLRPALGDNAGADGVGAFNDGSEQFVGGDFAEDIGEDFFGFKELGLDQEFGFESLSVPLHLLQNRMHSAYQANNTTAATISGVVFPPPEPYEPITQENVSEQAGVVQAFFLNKLDKNQGKPLVEDEDLPQKQRFPRPRLPPTGKISSPRKRPIREQQQMAKKKRKLEENKDDGRALTKPIGPLRLEMPDVRENGFDPEKEADSRNAMPSPESITAN